jgi:hypothetical protein
MDDQKELAFIEKENYNRNAQLLWETRITLYFEAYIPPLFFTYLAR